MKKIITWEINLEFKILPCPIEKIDAAFEFYVNSGLNEPIIIRKNTHVDFIDKKLDNVRFVKVNSLLVVREH